MSLVSRRQVKYVDVSTKSNNHNMNKVVSVQAAEY